MSSLQDRIELLENDLTAVPSRISVYHDLPFAILRYEPKEEWELRRQARLLATRLGEHGREVCFVSMADLLWEAIETTEGLDAVVELERQQGFEAAQDQVTTYLSDRDWRPLPDLLAGRLQGLDPKRHVVFLTRATAMAPAIYHMSKLLDEMQGQDPRDHDPLLPRLAGGDDRVAVHGPQGPRGAGQLPSENLRLSPRWHHEDDRRTALPRPRAKDRGDHQGRPG